jgi:hypothetical protein
MGSKSNKRVTLSLDHLTGMVDACCSNNAYVIEANRAMRPPMGFPIKACTQIIE